MTPKEKPSLEEAIRLLREHLEREGKPPSKQVVACLCGGHKHVAAQLGGARAICLEAGVEGGGF